MGTSVSEAGDMKAEALARAGREAVAGTFEALPYEPERSVGRMRRS